MGRLSHKYAFHFRRSARSRRGKSALDYSKIVIISNPDYLDSTPGIVDADEYTEMMRNMKVIVRKVLQYVEDYVSYHKCEENRISNEEFTRRYRFSTLRYFNDILGID